MADVTLSDGREIEFDLSKMTIKEYRALFDPAQPDEDEFKTLSKVTGVEADVLGNMDYITYRRLLTAFFAKAREPLADPN